MLPDRVSNPGPLTHESSALPIALRGPASKGFLLNTENHKNFYSFSSHNLAQYLVLHRCQTLQQSFFHLVLVSVDPVVLAKFIPAHSLTLKVPS